MFISYQGKCEKNVLRFKTNTIHVCTDVGICKIRPLAQSVDLRGFVSQNTYNTLSISPTIDLFCASGNIDFNYLKSD